MMAGKFSALPAACGRKTTPIYGMISASRLRLFDHLAAVDDPQAWPDERLFGHIIVSPLRTGVGWMVHEPPAVTKLGLLHDHPAAPIERDGELVGRRAHKQSKRLGVFRVTPRSISSNSSLLRYRGYSAGWAGAGSLSVVVADWLMQQATCQRVRSQTAHHSFDSLAPQSMGWTFPWASSSLFICLQLVERRPRHRPKHDIVVGQVDHEAVEAVGDRRAG